MAYSCVQYVKMASTPSQATAVPLRPELFEFIGVQGLGRLACCSAALREELRDAKAWQLLASAREPRSQREIAIDAERAAAARVRSHVLRRRLADRLSRRAVEPSFRPNKITDFTFFVRFEDDGEVIWEGDLKGCEFNDGNLTFSLSEAWSQMKNEWAGMYNFLLDDNIYYDGYGDIYMKGVSITVVAIRDEDQAMISLGHLHFDDCVGDAYAAKQIYIFESHESVLEVTHSYFKPWAVLLMTHDAQGNGTLDVLELGLMKKDDVVHMPHEFEFLLSYLAGIHHEARESALETIESEF